MAAHTNMRLPVPRQVDHNKRRAEVVEIATDLIAEGGLDALTVRNVAKAAGYSTAIVSHYFADKRELLFHIYRAAVARAGARTAAILAADPCDLDGCIDALLPLDDERCRDWQIWFAFWGMAVADPDFAAEQRARVTDAQALFKSIFEARRRAGLLPPDTDCEIRARLWVSLIDGLAVQAVFDRADWPPERQRRIIDEAIGQR